MLLARAVLMFIQPKAQIEDSWNGTYYENVIQVGRWENCREQGYVLSLANRQYSQLNIAFFEHRNSDSICAVKWEQSSMNSLTIETAVFGDVYKNKHDVSHSVGWGQVVEMAEWIIDEFNKHWQAGV